MTSTKKWPKLRKSLGIFIAGHSQERLNDNKLSKEENEKIEKILRDTVDKIIMKSQKILSSDGKNLNIVNKIYNSEEFIHIIYTGSFDGVDSWVRKWGGEKDVQIVVPGLKNNDELSKNYQIKVNLEGTIPEGEVCPSIRAYALRDQIVLRYSDILVAVWDGKEGRSKESGTLSSIRSGILRKMPVIWIDLKGSLRLLALGRLKEKDFLKIEGSDYLIEDLTSMFVNIENINRKELSVFLNQYFGVILPRKSSSSKHEDFMLIFDEKSGCELLEKNIPRIHIFFEKLFQRIGRLRGKETKKTSNGPEAKDDSVFLAWFSNRADVYAGYLRSSHWIFYGASFFAVLCALLGNQFDPLLKSKRFFLHNYTFGILELIFLVLVFFIHWKSQKSSWHFRWILHRQIAEQLRYTDALYKLLAFLPDQGRLASDMGDSNSSALSEWLRHRILVAEGLPKIEGLPQTKDSYYSPLKHLEKGKKEIQNLITGQISYHINKNNDRSLFNEGIEVVSIVLFALVAVVVILHFVWDQPALLIFTAGIPALAAALSAISNHSEAKKLIAQSEATVRELTYINSALDDIPKDDPWLAYLLLRKYAEHAGAVMSGENNLWTSIMKVHQLSLEA